MLRVLVKLGDMLALDQPVLELETDKATLEVPSDVAGRRARRSGQAGRQGQARPGRARRRRSGAGAAKASAPPAAAPAEAGARCRSRSPGQDATEPARPRHQGRRPGRGADSPTDRLRRKPVAAAADDRRRVAATGRWPSAASRRLAPAAVRGPLAPAAPSVRRLAREIGVDISQVPGTGPGGRITRGRRQGLRPPRDAQPRAAAALAPAAGDAPGVRIRRCPTSPSGARSSASRCPASAARPPSI